MLHTGKKILLEMLNADRLKNSVNMKTYFSDYGIHFCGSGLFPVDGSGHVTS